MSHFAKIDNGLVTQVIVAEQDYIDTLDGQWVQTSYNTYANSHPNNTPLRANFAGKGFTYDATKDVFYAPQPYPSWKLNKTTWVWEAPVARPQDGKPYTWDEENNEWVGY